jgi:hypothetical protein
MQFRIPALRRQSADLILFVSLQRFSLFRIVTLLEAAKGSPAWSNTAAPEQAK